MVKDKQDKAKSDTEKQEKLKLITTIAERRGFFYPTAEIYGGKAGFYTYGYLGKTLKNKFENLWREYFIEENFYEIEGNAILPENVFVASGHLKSFNDPLVECKTCNFRFRADQFLEDMQIKTEDLAIKDMNKMIKDKKLGCPKCNSDKLTDVEWFNMMFPIHLGPAARVEVAYLSPETAQNPYLAFKREFEAHRRKMPLGIAMIGKAFRNEISPRQLFFRLREFTQAEIQIFFDSAEIDLLNAKKWKQITNYKLILKPAREKESKILQITCEEASKKLRLPKMYLYYLAKIQKFYLESLKIPKEKFRFRELGEEERAFYNKLHWDIELELETLGGFKEVAGLHYRTDHDLAGHARHSKQDLSVFVNNKKFVPHVLELSFGVDRNIFSFLDIFFKQEKERTLFSFPKELAPVEIAVFPLVNKDKLPEKAREIYNMLNMLKQQHASFYDEDDSIGKRYRRVDEIGVPYAITLDYDSLKKDDCTIRERDTMKQKRVKIKDLVKELKS